ncbi:hypothetical protein ACLB1O_05800 [Escherichia coli]
MLNHTRLVGVVLLGTVALNIWLCVDPGGAFPEQDTGVLMGRIRRIRVFRFRRCAVSCRIS